MKKSLFKLKSWRKQQGIALIFALAMLSLLLIMAIGFATSAIFEQKAASNSASSTNARILAQSALNRVITLLGVYGANVQYSYDKYNPTTPTNNNDMLSHLSSFVSGAPLYTWKNTDPVGWEYLEVNDGTDNRLIGRFAYQVIPVAGLDPGALVAPGVDESLGTEPRPGKTVDEINLMSVSTADIVPPPSGIHADAKKLSYTAIGQYPGPATGWQSFKNLFTLTGITDTTLQTKFLKWFMLDTSRLKAKEAYRLDKSDPAYYHRFNLNRDWNTDFPPAVYPPVAMYEKILLDKTPASPGTPDGVPDQMPAAYSVSTTNDGYGIPWLAFFGYDKTGALDNTQKGTFASVIDRRRQIAANLVDYCRADAGTTIPPSSDVDPANWGATDPAFTGNKKTPYLNELGLDFRVTATRNPSTKITVSILADMTAELIDIYGITAPMATANIRVYYTVSYNFTGTTGIAVPAAVAGTVQYVDILIPAGNWTGIKRYATPTGWAHAYLTTTPVNNVAINKNTGATIVVNPTVTINKAILNYNGINVDCAKVNTASTSNITISLPKKTSTTLYGDYFVSFQVNDPRQNLNAGDWFKTETTAVAAATGYSPYTTGAKGTLNSRNNFNGSLVNSAGGPDADGTDPAYDNTAGKPGLSTAYIQGGPMKSPWELGFIYRGAAWETINLKAYDSDKATTFINTGSGIIPGGAAYITGDANVLDQIKMDNNTTNYKVNINAATDPATLQNVALQALLRNIPLGSTCADPGGTGVKINETNYPGALAKLVTAVSARTYQTRAAVAALAALYNGTCGIPVGTADAKQEELIGKFINLTDVSGRYFYIIVLAQAIKDIGGPGGAGIDIIKKSTDGTKVFKFTAANGGRAAKLGTFDYDAATGLYADEIIGEQKIKVLISLEPPSNTPRIISYEFIE
ncbi:MAG: hypothetical protein WCV67_20950 [Victivallaceae bacterium]|jgi:hypothetical protein